MTRREEAERQKQLQKEKRKQKNKKKRAAFKKFILWFFVIAVIAAVAFVVMVVRDLEITFGDSMNTLDLKLTSVVYSKNPKTEEWEEYEYLSSEGNRIWADIDVIPNYLEDAFIAIEDQRFISHNGVDWKRTFGAVYHEIFSGGSSYGGSSITQQLVKNLTGERDRKYTRKFKEIIRALILERKLSKQQILELYLNSIYLGQGCNGVESASQMYFNKSVNELSIAEAASIAGITQYPALYDPFQNKEKNIEKQRTVLGKMLELGFITKEDYDEAMAEELKFRKGDTYSNTSQSYFVDQVVEELIDDLCDEYGYSEAFAAQMVYNGGLKIYATVNKEAQEYAESVFEKENCIPRVSGDVQPEAAMVITEPSTGHVKVIVGGRGKKTLSRGLNRATQTKRQPGSAIKPLAVYAPALDLGLISPDTIVTDEPININGWQPKNHYSGFRGPMTVRNAVNVSANIPAIEVLQKVTIDKSFDYMTSKLNFTTLVDSKVINGQTYSDKNLASLALGGLTDGVTVLEMSAAYAVFPNDGMYNEPITYTRVEDNVGKTVLDNEQFSGNAFKSSTAYLTNQLLEGVVTSGTAAGSRISGMSTGGKTGTTDGDTDRWFVGYTPYYSAAVWVGYDTSKSLPSFSANPALTLWKNVMSHIHTGLKAKQFNRPSGMTRASVCSVTGLLSTQKCIDEEGKTTAVISYYDKANIPKIYCDGKHAEGFTAQTDTTGDWRIESNAGGEAAGTPGGNAGYISNGTAPTPVTGTTNADTTIDNPHAAPSN